MVKSAQNFGNSYLSSWSTFLLHSSDINHEKFWFKPHSKADKHGLFLHLLRNGIQSTHRFENQILKSVWAIRTAKINLPKNYICHTHLSCNLIKGKVELECVSPHVACMFLCITHAACMNLQYALLRPSLLQWSFGLNK